MKSFQNSSTKHKFASERAQAMAEFAIALPVLLMLLIGIFEVGRLIFIYAAVNNASREAARYASAVGLNDAGNDKYRDCDAIRTMAKRSAFFVTLPNNNIQIQYYRPNKNVDGTDLVVSGVLSEAYLGYECDQGTGEDPEVLEPDSGDRVKVTVTISYSPMLRLIPLKARTITSTSTRTILGVLELEP